MSALAWFGLAFALHVAAHLRLPPGGPYAELAAWGPSALLGWLLSRRAARPAARAPLLAVLAAVTLFVIDHLFIPVGLAQGALYLTSGSARFASKAGLPLEGIAWLAAALGLGVLVRGQVLPVVARRWGSWSALGAASLAEAAWLTASYLPHRDLDGPDALLVVWILPLAAALNANALYLLTGSLLAPAALEAATWFAERALLSDARLSFLPLGYVVIGEPGVYPARLACRLFTAGLLLVLLRRTRHVGVPGDGGMIARGG